MKIGIWENDGGEFGGKRRGNMFYCSLDSDQDQQNVGHNLDLNCLTF